MSKKTIFLLGALALVVALFPYKSNLTKNTAEAAAASFTYSCSMDGTLKEAGAMSQTTSPYWWLNSGAYMNLSGGICKTSYAELPSTDYWRVLYNQTSAVDTDNGYHPQNLFRLVTKSTWGGTVTQQVRFNMSKLNLSASDQRNAWSGVLLFNRYQSGQTLYYAGIRDDGHAVIKSKKNGTYVTLKEVPVFPGTYNRDTNPTLLPFNKWMKIKTVVSDVSGGVKIDLYLDKDDNNTWTLVASATDTNNPITSAGYAGIRTDFRDVMFDDYKVSQL